MPSTTVVRTIAAPIERVFETVSDIANFSEAIPQIVRVEFLTEQKLGVGTRFKETRRMGGKEACTELEVTELVLNEHVRLVADSHGTVWDSIFTVREAPGGGTELKLYMEARAHKLLPRLLNPLIMWMIKKAVAGDMDAVKAHCEG